MTQTMISLWAGTARRRRGGRRRCAASWRWSGRRGWQRRTFAPAMTAIFKTVLYRSLHSTIPNFYTFLSSPSVWILQSINQNTALPSPSYFVKDLLPLQMEKTFTERVLQKVVVPATKHNLRSATACTSTSKIRQTSQTRGLWRDFNYCDYCYWSSLIIKTWNFTQFLWMPWT